MTSKTTKNGKTRINLRIPSDLDDWVKQYASDNNTSMTQIIVQYLTEFRKRVEEANVEQF